jgi:hypothetical protein
MGLNNWFIEVRREGLRDRDIVGIGTDSNDSEEKRGDADRVLESDATLRHLNGCTAEVTGT